MKKLIATAVLACTVATGALAGPNPELSKPVVILTSVIGKNVEALALTEEQRADLKAWVSTMPAKRKSLEDQAIAARAALRQAIVDGAPVADRQAIAQEVGALETKLVMMRSNCVDHWRAVLNAEQFNKALKLAGLK